MKSAKRIVSLLLCGVMLLGYLPASAFAQEPCIHHPEHTEECGYSAAVEGHICNHEHTNECYQSVAKCIHIHGACSYVPAVEGHGCDCQPDESGETVHAQGCGYMEAVEEVPCDHVCSVETGCVTVILNCQHLHDDDCGYVAEAAESPCTFQCDICAQEAAEDSGTTDIPAESVTITQEEGLREIFVGESLVLTAVVLPENATDMTITWLSSDETIAVVDENGVVTGVAEGDANIIAKVGGIQEYYALSIKAPAFNQYNFLSTTTYKAGSFSTTDEVVAFLDMLCGIQNGMYWNKRYFQQDLIDQFKAGDFTSSIDITPCSDTKCTSNTFDGRVQCNGYAAYLAYIISGETNRVNEALWTNTVDVQNYVQGITIDDVQPGDVIAYYNGNSQGGQHWVVVWKIIDGKLYVAEANAGGNCKIHFGPTGEQNLIFSRMQVHARCNKIKSVPTVGLTPSISPENYLRYYAQKVTPINKTATTNSSSVDTWKLPWTNQVNGQKDESLRRGTVSGKITLIREIVNHAGNTWYEYDTGTSSRGFVYSKDVTVDVTEPYYTGVSSGSITTDNAVLKGTFMNTTGVTLKTGGFYLSTIPDAVTNGRKITENVASGYETAEKVPCSFNLKTEYSLSIASGTTYYYVLYATDSTGKSYYSDEDDFTTTAASPYYPSVSIGSITADNAVITATCNNPNGITLKTGGFYLSTKSGAVTNGTKYTDNIPSSYQTATTIPCSFNLKNEYKIALQSGTTYYYVLYVTDSGGKFYYSGERSFKTLSVPVTSISVSPSSKTLDIGGSVQLTATPAPTNATNKAVTWTSSNTAVATVSASGLVTAKTEGTATIRATAKDGSEKYGTAIITVTCAHSRTAIDPEVKPTCTKTGLTEGKHCSVCNAVLVAQKVVPATGHTEVIDKAVAPTCTGTGLTEGKHCSVCNTVLIAQQTVSAQGHSYTDTVTAPTCTNKGFTTHTCSACGDSYSDTYVDALGHDLQSHAPKAATCTEPGWEAYKACKRCDYTTYKEIPAAGHSYQDVVTAPTCTNKGFTTHTCAVCGNHYVDTYVDALGHAEVIDPAVPATCTETGLTEGKHCSVCGEVLVAQQTTPAAHQIDGVCCICGLIAGPCGDHLTYTLTADGILTITGTGDMADYSEASPAPWYKYRSEITGVVLSQEVTSIGDYAFNGCSGMTSIMIGENVASIGQYAFLNCDGLREIIFSGDAPEIASTAFTGVTADVHYPAGNPTWDPDVMQSCGGTITWLGKEYQIRSFRIDREYVVLAIGESAQLTIEVDSDLTTTMVSWSVDNEAVISVDDCGMVTAKGSGTSYVTATAALGDDTYTARCRIDVTGTEPSAAVTGVQLGTIALTTELFRRDYAAFDVILLLAQNQSAFSASTDREALADNGVAVISARFLDEAVAERFDLVVKDDRTLLVVPKDTAINNPGSVAGSYTSRIVVNVSGTEFTTGTSLKLTVKKTVPKLKAASLSFNSFYPGQSAPITITGATVTGISPNAAKDNALPAWLTLSGSVLMLTEDAPEKSSSASVYLSVNTEEWAIPASVTVLVKLAYKAPKLKLSAASVSFANAYEFSNGLSLKLLCTNKKDTLEGLNVSDILPPVGFEVREFNRADGSFILKPTKQIVAGKKTILVAFSDTGKQLPLTVTVSTKPVTLSAKPTSVILNSVVGDSAVIQLTTAPADYQLTAPTFRLIDSTGAITNQLDVAYSGGAITINTNDATLSGATYKLYVSAGGSKETVITVKTLAQNKSTIALSAKTSGSIDLSFPESYAVILPTFRSYNSGLCTLENWSVTAFKNREELGDVTEAFDFVHEGGQYRMKAAGDLVVGNTYHLTMTFALEGGSTYSCSVKVPVKRTAVKLKLSKTSLSLNKAIEEWATVDVSCLTKGYDFIKPVISGTYDLDVAYSSGKLTVRTNEHTQYGAVYKLQLRATELDPPVTLTIKVPQKEQSTVAASLKAKGTIDVVRDSTSVIITPTYKNYTGETAIEKTISILCSMDGKNYSLDVTEQFRITPNENGTYTIAKRPGAELNTALKYRVVLSFSKVENSKPAYTALSLKSGKATVKLGETAVLYKNDRYCRSTFHLTAADQTLNQISRVEIKDAKLAALYAIYSYGNGEYAIGFQDNNVGAVKSVNITLNIFMEGNISAKPNATVTLKLQIR